MFKNKHITVAMIVAPLLALISYFATDFIVGEDPKVAEQGQSYPMVARSNCRYVSGVCTLVNGDLEVKLSLGLAENGTQVLQISSNQKLEGVRIALTDGSAQAPIQEMQPSSEDATLWHTGLQPEPTLSEEIRLAMMSTGAIFYASVGTEFFEHDARYPEPIVN